MGTKKIFLIVGRLAVDSKVVYEVIKKNFSFSSVKCVFISKAGYLKSRFDYANATGRKIEAIFVGPIPHKTFAAGKSNSMISEVNIANSITPVYICKSKGGSLKFTKTSIRTSVKAHLDYLESKKRRQILEDPEVKELKDLLTYLFPNQTVLGVLLCTHIV